MHVLPVNHRSGNGRIHLLEVVGNASVGGMENYILNFLTHLPKEQFRVTCICPYESTFTTLLRKLGVEEVYVTSIEDDPSWRSIQLVVEMIKLHKTDVLHAHMPKAHVLAGIAGCLAHKPVAATIHGMHVTAHEYGIARAVNSHLITNCQEAYSQALALGVPPNRVYRVRNGIDTTVFRPDKKGNSLRKAINIPVRSPLVGFVGRLDPEKGADLFLQSAEFIHRIKPDVHFVIVGDGSKRKELAKMCVRLRLQKHVHFVGWCDDMSGIYPQLDILAHTSRSDGTSLVLQEAMACGCPAVALAVGGVREVIENRATGTLAVAGDWEGIAHRVIALLENPDLLKTMGIAARARIEKYFNVQTNTLRTAEILRGIALGANKQPFNNNGTLELKNGKASLETLS